MINASIHLIAYCPFNEKSMISGLGQPDYSYGFVFQKFLPLLAELTTVTSVSDEMAIEGIALDIRLSGRTPLLLSFAPPHRTPLSGSYRSIPVFAWEFDTIPCEDLDDDSRSNWSFLLSHLPGAITHSLFAVNVVKRQVGSTYPIASIPSPVWDDFAFLPDTAWTGRPRSIVFTGAVIDTLELALENEQDCELTAPLEIKPHNIELSGLVFTLVANPCDGRKNWRDILTAFVYTFRDRRDATFVFKMVHHDRDRCCSEAWSEIARLTPFLCRIVVIHGFLETDSFRQLIGATTFTVNASSGEGQCLPLMEFMSASTPAIAPSHTALSEYVNSNNSLTIESSPAWTIWPHDPRQRLTCMHQQINWESICESFEKASAIAYNSRPLYQEMCNYARKSLEQYCSLGLAKDKLCQFINGLFETRI